MNDENVPDTEGGGEDGQEAEPRKGSGANLSDLVKSAMQTAAWYDSIAKQFEPVVRQIAMLDPTRRSIAAAIGPTYQAALQYQAITAPVLTLQADLSGIYDWHSHINDVVRNVSLPRTLLDQLAAEAALFLPANLAGLDTEDLYAVLDLSQDDGVTLSWAPRTEIVKALLPLPTREQRYALLAEHRDDVLDDVDASLRVITHPELAGMVTILRTATRTARAGFSEGAQALAWNVLETAMKGHGNAWIRRSFPQVTYPPKAGHHGTIGSVLDDTDEWGDLTLLQFKHYLVLAGMRNAFGPGTTQDTFNRHLGAHRASPDSYRPEFTLPAVLLAHALLRALNQDLERDDGEDEA
jgi:hypothetical protein